MADVMEDFDGEMYPPDRPPLVKTCELKVGEHKFHYGKNDRKVAAVYIVGMRGKPIKLRRRPFETYQNMMPGARGVPTMYALKFDDRSIHVWPAPVHDMWLQIEYSDVMEDPDPRGE